MFRTPATLLAIALGGAAGALCRFWVSFGVHRVLGQGFPYGTLMVNWLGCLVMGMLYVLLLERMAVSVEWRAGLLVGVLGAFTTFSTFSIETVNLIEQGALSKAVVNVVASAVGCLVLTWFGVLAARQLQL